MGESNRLKLASKPKPEQFFTISGRDKLWNLQVMWFLGTD